MIETDAVVVSVDGNHVWVRAAAAPTACGTCAGRAGCGTAAAADAGNRMLRLPNTIHARPGDAVVIRAADGQVIKAVWRAYGLPLLLGLAAAVLATALGASEPLAGGALLVGLAGGFLLLRAWHPPSVGAEPILSLDFKYSSFVIFKE